MSILRRREPTIDEILSGQVMQTVLQHVQKTPDDMRAMMRAVAKRSPSVRAVKTERRSPAELRATVRALVGRSRACSDPQAKQRLAAQALLLARRAEQLERKQKARRRA